MIRWIDSAITAGRRLRILKALAVRPQHHSDLRNLRTALEAMGYPMTLIKLAVDFAFLAALGLVDAPTEGMVRLTDDGLSVVNGLIHLPGVGSPEQGAF